MSKTFTEVLTEIREGVAINKKGKQVKTFSRSDFDKLAKAFVNETGYETESVTTKEGDVVKKTVKPVEGFRGMIQAILKDFGVDKEEASRVLTDAYEVKNVNGLYEFVSELIYVYMNAGKKFDFMTKDDFKGSLTVDEVEESSKTYAGIKDKSKTYEVKKEKHKILNRKSQCPKWKKTNK